MRYLGKGKSKIDGLIFHECTIAFYYRPDNFENELLKKDALAFIIFVYKYNQHVT